MKKITLLLVLLMTSFGFSQSLPFTFDESADPGYYFTGFDVNFALATDPDDSSNEVGQISGNGANFDTLQTIGLLAENIDLSDDNNNTITFRWRAVNGTGSGSHLLKFELDGNNPIELPFTSSGTNWQTISIDFGPGLGVYNNLIIFPDFNNAGNDIYLIDDLAGGTNVTPPPPPTAEFPIDFESADDTFNCFDCGFSIVQDNGDNVGSISGSGLPFDTAQLPLGTLLDLSDDANNTITFRIKPVNGTGSGSHLLKFELGSEFTELPFTTTGTEWQDITLDYPAGLGTYDLLVIFPDFNNGGIDTYFIDDIAGGTNVMPAVPPSTPAPTPTTPDSNVFNLYSDSPGYTNNMVYDYSFGELGGPDPDLDSSPTVVNLALWFDFAPGWGSGQNNPTDISAYDDYISFHYYTSDATQFYLDIISQGTPNQEAFYTIGVDEAIVYDEWTQVIIPRSFFETNYPNFDPVNWFQYKFDVPSDLFQGTVYIDNLYFSNVSPTVLSTNEFSISNFKAYPNPTSNVWNVEATQNITNVVLFDILGKPVMNLTPNASNVPIDATQFSKGIYFATFKTRNGSNSIKLIKN